MPMATFIVERYLPGMSRDALAGIVDSVAHTTFDPSVQYRGSIIVPGDEACLCLFEADHAEAVRVANESLGLPVARVVAAAVMDLPAGRPADL